MSASNTIITSDIITNEALRILHERLQFTAKISRKYEDKFAKRGAKIGSTVDIRLPAQLATREGWTMGDQDFVQESIPLTVGAPIGVDCSFDDADLILDLNDFSKDYIEPAMAQLATAIEAKVNKVSLQALNSVYNGSGLGYKDLLKIPQKMFESLAPMDSSFCFIVNPASQVEIIYENRGLFVANTERTAQFMNAKIGSMAGLDFYRSNILPKIVNPADIVGTVDLTEDSTSATLKGLTDGQVVPAGFRFTVADSFKVHPETKDNYTDLFEFVVVNAVTVGAVTTGEAPVTLVRAPKSSASGARQNISALPALGSAITAIGGAGETMRTNVAMVKDAFTLASVDLTTPSGMDMASTKNIDGLSLSFVRGFDITNRRYVSRFDWMGAIGAVRPEWAVLGLEPDV
jgi:hypothetical protein